MNPELSTDELLGIGTPDTVAVASTTEQPYSVNPGDVVVTTTVAEPVLPTQVANAGRTTWRSIFQLVLALVTALPQIVPIITGAWSPEWLTTVAVQVLLVHGVVTRIMALPGVNAWIEQHAAWLAPSAATTK